MRRLSPSARLVALGFAGLALFALLLTVGASLGVVPAPPEGGFSGIDLAAGLAFGLALLIYLVRFRG